MPKHNYKVTPDQLKKIISLLEDNISYSNIVEQMKVDGLSISAMMVGKIRKKYNVKPKNNVRVTTAVHRKRYLKRKNIVDHRIHYDFLTNIREVFRWGLKMYDLTQEEMDLLLYLYPKYIFKTSEFNIYQNEVIKPKRNSMFDDFVKSGLVVKFRGKTVVGEPPLYQLSEKAKEICSKMHLACTGEFDFKPKRSDKVSYFNDLLKGI